VDNPGMGDSANEHRDAGSLADTATPTPVNVPTEVRLVRPN
jgi:hypothetical protein